MDSSAVLPASTAPLLPYAYAPLPSSAADADRGKSGGVRWRACAAVVAALVLVVVVATALLAGGRVDVGPAGEVSTAASVPATKMVMPMSRGKDFGVSEKSSGAYSADGGYPWSNAMLQWQRTGFHFQPEQHYMNDPNGPVYYGGWYHLFYQHNPKGDNWGNIAWAHAVSKDMVNWRHLPLAMVPDQWYDSNGVLTGSITVLPDGQVILLYTGNTDTH